MEIKLLNMGHEKLWSNSPKDSVLTECRFDLRHGSDRLLKTMGLVDTF